MLSLFRLNSIFGVGVVDAALHPARRQRGSPRAERGAVSTETLDRLEAAAELRLGDGLLLSAEEGEAHRRCSICLIELCISEPGGVSGSEDEAEPAIKGGGPPILLDCGHVFHRECGAEWLATNATCPECRAAVSDELPAPAAAAGAHP